MHTDFTTQPALATPATAAPLPPMPILEDNAALRQLLDDFQAAAASCNAEQCADARHALLQEMERQMADYARQALCLPNAPAHQQLT